MKKEILVTILAITILASIATVMAKQINPGHSDNQGNSTNETHSENETNVKNDDHSNNGNHPNFGKFLNDGNVPRGSKLILNLNLKVKNDEDSGNVGYWALDDYQKHIQVWNESNGTFYSIVRYEGKWRTFAGALSPGNGTNETKNATGTFHGGYVATFNGVFDPGSQKTHGSLGTKNYNGTVADILKGKYGNGQTGPATPFDWVSAYFANTTNFTQTEWGWRYSYRSQTWNNFKSGTSGDIIA